jgi:hypothetical protein
MGTKVLLAGLESMFFHVSKPDPSYFRFGFSLISPEVLFWWIAILCRAPWTPLLLDDYLTRP